MTSRTVQPVMKENDNIAFVTPVMMKKAQGGQNMTSKPLTQLL